VWAVRSDEAVYVSPRVESILGYTSDEWRPPDFWMTRIHPDDRQAVLAATLRSSTTGEPFAMEYRYLAKDGHIVWVLDQAILLERDASGMPAIFHGLMLDITDRKEAEAKSVEHELRYRTLASQIPAITYLWAPTTPTASRGITKYISEQVRSVLGFSPAEWTAEPDFWIGRLHPADRGRVLESANRVMPTGEPFSLQYRLIAADDSIVWIRDEGRAIAFDERGRPAEWQGIMLDVTEHERAQQALQTAELRFRALVEHIPAIVYVELPTPSAAESRFLYLSPQTEQVLGYTPEELISDPGHLDRMLHPDDRDRILAANERSERTGLPFDEEYRVIAKDGRIVWFHSRASLVQDAGRPVWQGVALDVTDQHEMSDSMRDLEERRTPSEPIGHLGRPFGTEK
jgi:PAS domain S-box-containing protein